MTDLFEGPIWLIGCGNMAGAMLEGWLRAGADPRQFTVVRPSGRPVAGGVRVLTAFPEDEVPALVLLGVKPQKLDEVAPALASVLDPATIFVSILAGVELAALRGRFPAVRNVAKAMPNLPVALGKGVVELCTDADGAAARGVVERLMAALGETIWFDDESLFNVASALTAAAPAFLFRFLDALAAAAAELGLPPDQAARLAARMAEGAAALAATSDATPQELARRVASPGGTTEAGLNVLDAEDGLRPLILRTLAASRRRGEEMAAAARGG
ncbi:pyrroline-5-carboxylate reductase [Sphingomonas parva]|uniref:Pyrroline-5-carboxylate reductase n=1 Tax=Sphingomonas parva TaxID=2555898 RepID=A0A4Y8ZRS8_9SPHN|nr:pyrroline-5-carboxylate reductase dimerization domain-containing protein [Sphingomonas parva]TFI58002.1 pyrroline-5-carboxylate reductase [Sphingomonas parva]